MNLIEMIKRHERFATTYRIDDLSRFGYGHRSDEFETLEHLKRDLGLYPLTEEEAEQQLAADVLFIYEWLLPVIPLEKHNYKCQQACIALVYFCGLHEFCLNKSLVKALSGFDYEYIALLVMQLKPLEQSIEIARLFLEGAGSED